MDYAKQFGDLRRRLLAEIDENQAVIDHLERDYPNDFPWNYQEVHKREYECACDVLTGS